MGRKSKYTLEQKIKAVEDYKNGKRGTMQICKDLNMREVNLYKWITIYNDFGEIYTHFDYNIKLNFANTMLNALSMME